jgi:hypothetical protein
MRTARLTALISLPFALSLLAATYTGRVRAAAAADCEGEACRSLTLTWENERQQFRADNISDRNVKVEVTVAGGGTSALHLEPHKSDYLQVKTFDGPYRADFE